jgi:hypothetical protein
LSNKNKINNYEIHTLVTYSFFNPCSKDIKEAEGNFVARKRKLQIILLSINAQKK